MHSHQLSVYIMYTWKQFQISKENPLLLLRIRKKIYQDLSSQLDQINNQLTEISKAHYTFLKCAEEELDIENKKLDVIKNLGVTKDTFAMEGWIPKSKLESVKAELLKHSDGTTRLYQLETKETPPTLLDNPKNLKILSLLFDFIPYHPATNLIQPLYLVCFFQSFMG